MTVFGEFFHRVQWMGILAMSHSALLTLVAGTHPMMDSLLPNVLGLEEVSQLDIGFTSKPECLPNDVSSPPGLPSALSFQEERAACLLQNGRFEKGLTHWVTLEGTEQISQTNIYVGEAALFLSTAESGIYQEVPVMPGQILQLMSYSRSTSQAYSSFGMSFFDKRRRFLCRSDVGAIVSAKWNDYCAVAIAPTHATYVQIWAYQCFDHGVTHIDGFSLRQIYPKDLPTRPVNRFRLIHAPLDPAANIFI
ncbi:MAG: hypothetical protein AAF579_03500 [Cyanobacteria bacterium P01_C01_bin.118]